MGLKHLSNDCVFHFFRCILQSNYSESTKDSIKIMYKYVAKYLMLEKVYKFCEVTSFPSLLIGLVLFAFGAFQALFIASADVQQDEVYRIIYIHVPSAILSELIYLFLANCGLIFLVWKTKISTIYLNSAVPIGIALTLLVLITGSLWGKPTWGTYWVWDARITSTFILLLQYIGLYVLRTSFNSISTSDTVISIFAIIGAINIPIIKFSVNWWNTLHQGPSITSSGSTIAGEFLTILILMMISLLFLSYAIFARNIQSEILLRTRQSKRLQGEING